MSRTPTAGAADLYFAFAHAPDEPVDIRAAVGTYETKQVESQDEDDAAALLGRQGL